MTVEKELFGCLDDGREVYRFWLRNSKGISAAFLNFGATIQKILVPDRNGKAEDIVLGYETAEEYVSGSDYFGATVGRVANRIAGAEMELEGTRYQLTANEGSNTLHGGDGFHKKLWDFEIAEESLVLKYNSPDGEDGFPGALQVRLSITLSEESVLRLEYHAESDRTTVCSLTGHSYFNLTGTKTQMISGHQLQLGAKEYTPVDSNLIPTGEILSVEGTKYDFRSARPIGTEDLDGNLVLSCAFRKWDARVLEPSTGRFLTVKTSLPGMQLYNGSAISSGPFTGFALEPQFYPDAVHHPNFPQPILKAGETYDHFIEYRFGVF